MGRGGECGEGPGGDGGGVTAGTEARVKVKKGRVENKGVSETSTM